MTEGDRMIELAEVVELADAVAASDGIATGMGLRGGRLAVAGGVAAGGGGLGRVAEGGSASANRLRSDPSPSGGGSSVRRADAAAESGWTSRNSLIS